jgi:hypothetical protein
MSEDRPITLEFAGQLQRVVSETARQQL